MTKLLDRLPLHAGTLPKVVAGAALLACAEFVRNGLYVAYLPKVSGAMLGLPKADAVMLVSTALSVHFISDTAMRAPAGAALLRYGLRRVVLLGSLLSLLAVAVLSVTKVGWLLLLVAALHGIGFSPLWPALMSLTADSAHSTHQGRVLTTVTMSVMPVIGVGTLLMGAVAEAGLPRSLVFSICLMVLGAAVALALALPDRLRSAPAAKEQAQTDKTSGVRVAFEALAPLIPAAFLQTLTMTLLGPLLFTLYPEMHLSYWQMVALLAVGGVAAFASMPQTGKFADGGHARLSVTLGFGLLMTGMLGLSLLPPLWALFVMAAFVGLGYAFIAPGWAALVAHRLPEAQRPAAWGTLMTVENIGNSLGPILGAFAYRTWGVTGPFIVAAALAGLATVGYVLLGRLLERRPAE